MNLQVLPRNILGKVKEGWPFSPCQAGTKLIRTQRSYWKCFQKKMYRAKNIRPFSLEKPSKTLLETKWFIGLIAWYWVDCMRVDFPNMTLVSIYPFDIKDSIYNFNVFIREILADTDVIVKRAFLLHYFLNRGSTEA